jgi:predicted transcriptional regulator of viral defense system
MFNQFHTTLMRVEFLSKSVLHPTEPTNYTGSYTAEYRVIIAGILKKGVNN